MKNIFILFIFYSVLSGAPCFAGEGLPEYKLSVNRGPFITQRIDHESNSPQVEIALYKNFRYGIYSQLIFRNGRNIEKKTPVSGSGIVSDNKLKSAAIAAKNIQSLDEVIEKVSEKRLVFVGEDHSAYSHHLVQLEIIKKIFRKKGKVIIGMEMFQVPFQKYLEQYIQGKLSEKDFLDKTEYYKRWGYRYHLYRDIIHFARENRIMIIALNLEQEIVRKVAREGISALSEEENTRIPRNMDMTNDDYRMYLKKIFHHHSGMMKMKFEDFYQSQVLWDETMAHNIVKTLGKYPDLPMVVLAGNGHLRNAWGIPGRVRRQSEVDFSIVLNDERPVGKEIADYIIYPEKVELPRSPSLRVMLDMKDGQIVITAMMPGGPAYKAGLKKGDIILSMDNENVRNSADIKKYLMTKKTGDIISIKVERKHYFFLTKVITVKVRL